MFSRSSLLCNHQLQNNYRMYCSQWQSCSLLLIKFHEEKERVNPRFAAFLNVSIDIIKKQYKLYKIIFFMKRFLDTLISCFVRSSSVQSIRVFGRALLFEQYSFCICAKNRTKCDIVKNSPMYSKSQVCRRNMNDSVHLVL